MLFARTAGAIVEAVSGFFSGRLSRVERKIDLLSNHGPGARAVYIGNNRVLVKTLVGGHTIAYFVEADDKLISPWFILTGTYETDVTDFFVREIGRNSHCLDVGSNFGFFSCLFARLAPEGRVFGVEADERIYELCRDNLVINGLHGIGTAMHAAANDSGEPLKLNRRLGRSGNTSIITYDRLFTDLMGEPPAEQFTVRGLKLDALLPQLGGRVDFIKIDVEGSEPLALRGAQDIIATNPQLKIVMEWSPGQIQAAGLDVSAFVAWLSGQGLSFYRIDKGRPRKVSATELLATDYMSGVLLQR